MGTSLHSPEQLGDLIARLDVGDANNYYDQNNEPGLVDLLGLLFVSFTYFIYIYIYILEESL